MQQTNRKITDAEYIEEYMPIGMWVLVERDTMPDKTSGGIFIARKTMSENMKFSGTGIIRKLPHRAWLVHQETHDGYWIQNFREGDHVGFAASVPIVSAAPLTWLWVDSGEDISTKFVTIAVTDIIAILLHTEEQRTEFGSRLTSKARREA